MLKHLTFAALASTAFAQTTPQDLNATLASTPELSNLTTYLGMFPDVASSLASATNITILAPNNDAFGKLLASPMGSQLATNPGLIQAVLTYHVLNGTYASNQITEDSQFIPTLLMDSTYTNVTGGQRVGVEEEDDRVVFYSGLLMNSTVTQADVQFTGGVVHIIDTVLTVPANASTTALAANLTALAGALTTADLVSAVDTTPDLTIFAPTNEAFAAIGSALANATAEELASVLTYHVVNGTVAYSAGLQPEQTVTTLNGAELTIRVQDDGDVFVNGAKVVVADVLVANGVVHVIDNVLNPANATASPPSDDDDDNGAAQFGGATAATDVPYTSGVPTPTAPVGGGSGNVSGGATPTAGSETPMPSSGAGKGFVSGGLMGVAVGLGGVVFAL